MKVATEKRLEEVMDLAECVKLGKRVPGRGNSQSIHVVSGKFKESRAAKAETGEWSLRRCQSMNWSAKTLVKTLRGAVLKTSTAAQAQEGLEELSHDEGQEGRW